VQSQFKTSFYCTYLQYTVHLIMRFCPIVSVKTREVLKQLSGSTPGQKRWQLYKLSDICDMKVRISLASVCGLNFFSSGLVFLGWTGLGILAGPGSSALFPCQTQPKLFKNCQPPGLKPMVDVISFMERKNQFLRRRRLRNLFCAKISLVRNLSNLFRRPMLHLNSFMGTVPDAEGLRLHSRVQRF